MSFRYASLILAGLVLFSNANGCRQKRAGRSLKKPTTTNTIEQPITAPVPQDSGNAPNNNQPPAGNNGGNNGAGSHPIAPTPTPIPTPIPTPTPGPVENPSTISPAPVDLTQKKGESFKAYTGYFVKNSYKVDDKDIYVVLKDKASFDEVFGTAMVMGDKSHRLDNDVFEKEIILAVIHRAGGTTKFNISEFVIADDALTIKYTTEFTASPTAQFASPLIVSIAKGKYKQVIFEENQKQAAKVNLAPANPLLD